MANDTSTATARSSRRWHAGGAGYRLTISVAARDRFFRREWRNGHAATRRRTRRPDVVVNGAKNSFWNGTRRALFARDIGRWFVGLGALA